MILGPAGPEHVAELVRLINAAYAVGEAGLWIDATPRTDEAEIAASVAAGEMVLASADGSTVGCARVRALDETTAEVGLITVDPRAWGGGTGRTLIDAAEDIARSRGATTMKLNLLVPRDGVHPSKERLHAWYARRGYAVYDRVPFEDVVPDAARYLVAPGDVLLFSKPLR